MTIEQKGTVGVEVASMTDASFKMTVTQLSDEQSDILKKIIGQGDDRTKRQVGAEVANMTDASFKMTVTQLSDEQSDILKKIIGQGDDRTKRHSRSRGREHD